MATFRSSAYIQKNDDQKSRRGTSRIVELHRNRNGYGFTISSQRPCILSHVVSGSASAQVGLKAGDLLLGINGIDVSNAPHDDVVRLVGSSGSSLLLTVGENQANSSSDSSSDEYSYERKAVNRNGHGEKLFNKNRNLPVNAGGKYSSRYPLTSRQALAVTNAGGRNKHQRHVNDFAEVENLNPRLSSSGNYNKQHAISQPKDNCVKHTVITKAQRLGVDTEGGISSRPRTWHNAPEGNKLERKFAGPSGENAKGRPSVHRSANCVNAVVGYIGSIDLPGEVRIKKSNMQSMRNAVRRLRLENRIKKHVMLSATEEGIRLFDNTQKIIAFYESMVVAACGICAEDKRMFAILTTDEDVAASNGELDSNEQFPLTRSCHIFIMDPELLSHKAHMIHAQRFGIQCVRLTSRWQCNGFPDSATSLVAYISETSCAQYDWPLYDGLLVQLGFLSVSVLPEAMDHRDSGAVSDSSSGAGVAEENNDHEEARIIEDISDACELDATAPSPSAVPLPAPEVTMQDLNKAFSERDALASSNRSVPTMNSAFDRTAGSSEVFLDSADEAEFRASNAALRGDRHVSSQVGVKHINSKLPTPTRPKSAILPDVRYTEPSNAAAAMNVDSSESRHYPATRIASRLYAMQDQKNAAVSRHNSQLANKKALSNSYESLMAAEVKRLEQMTLSTLEVDAVAVQGQGHVARWATNFDNLLADTSGRAVFAEFLRKEFSEENIIFWTKCEQFRQITDDSELKKAAHAIYKQHLQASASEPVNVDSDARLAAEQCLDCPTQQLFSLAQKQVYKLMKMDSYQRFLKSDIYKQCVLADMEGRPLPHSSPVEASKLTLVGTADNDNKDAGRAKEKKDNEKRRKSLLPWSKGKSDKQLPKMLTEPNLSSRAAEDVDESKANKRLSLGGDKMAASLSVEPVEASVKDKEAQKTLVKVTFPDGSSLTVSCNYGDVTSAVVSRLCERRNLHLSRLEILDAVNLTTVSPSSQISQWAESGVKLEKRIIFRLDFIANKCSVGVRARPGVSLRSVLEPCASQLNFDLNESSLHISGKKEALDWTEVTDKVDGKRLLLQTAVSVRDVADKAGKKAETKPPVPHKLDSSSEQQFSKFLSGSLIVDFDFLGLWQPNAKSTKGSEGKSTGLFGFMRRNKDVSSDGKKTKDGANKEVDKRGGSTSTVRKSLSEDIASTNSEGNCVSENSSQKKDALSDAQLAAEAGDETLQTMQNAGDRHGNTAASLASSIKSTPDLTVRSKKTEETYAIRVTLVRGNAQSPQQLTRNGHELASASPMPGSASKPPPAVSSSVPVGASVLSSSLLSTNSSDVSAIHGPGQAASHTTGDSSYSLLPVSSANAHLAASSIPVLSHLSTHTPVASAPITRVSSIPVLEEARPSSPTKALSRSPAKLTKQSISASALKRPMLRDSPPRVLSVNRYVSSPTLYTAGSSSAVKRLSVNPVLETTTPKLQPAARNSADLGDLTSSSVGGEAKPSALPSSSTALAPPLMKPLIKKQPVSAPGGGLVQGIPQYHVTNTAPVRQLTVANGTPLQSERTPQQHQKSDRVLTPRMEIIKGADTVSSFAAQSVNCSITTVDVSMLDNGAASREAMSSRVDLSLSDSWNVIVSPQSDINSTSSDRFAPSPRRHDSDYTRSSEEMTYDTRHPIRAVARDGSSVFDASIVSYFDTQSELNLMPELSPPKLPSSNSDPLHVAATSSGYEQHHQHQALPQKHSSTREDMTLDISHAYPISSNYSNSRSEFPTALNSASPPSTPSPTTHDLVLDNLTYAVSPLATPTHHPNSVDNSVVSEITFYTDDDANVSFV